MAARGKFGPAGRRMILTDLAATEALAARIAARLRLGDAVLLEGPLGAGKTAFARALLRAAVGDPALEVPSPSYTLVQSYDAPAFTLHHFDLWRLSGPSGLVELGWDDARQDVVLVEWPDRLGELWPQGALAISFRVVGDTSRAVALAGWDAARIGDLAQVAPETGWNESQE